jgi:hypothetical protein
MSEPPYEDLSPAYTAVPLVTDQEARNHLRIDGTPESPPSAADDLLTMYILQASDIVIDYIKQYEHTWTDTTAPHTIKAAVLLVLNVLYDNPADDPLTPGVKNILHRYRDPALA